MAKNNLLKTILGISIGALAITATVSIIKNINKPGNDPSITTPVEPEVNKNLATFDFRSTEDYFIAGPTKSLTYYMNEHSTNERPIFGGAIHNQGVSLKKELGIQIGTGGPIGGTYLRMSFVDSYTFNHAKIVATNYCKKNTSPEDDGRYKYDKVTERGGDSQYRLNNSSDIIDLPMNADLYVQDEIITSTFIFEEAQKELFIEAGGTCCFLSLELWTE